MWQGVLPVEAEMRLVTGYQLASSVDITLPYCTVTATLSISGSVHLDVICLLKCATRHFDLFKHKPSF